MHSWFLNSYVSAPIMAPPKVRKLLPFLKVQCLTSGLTVLVRYPIYQIVSDDFERWICWNRGIGSPVTFLVILNGSRVIYLWQSQAGTLQEPRAPKITPSSFQLLWTHDHHHHDHQHHQHHHHRHHRCSHPQWTEDFTPTISTYLLIIVATFVFLLLAPS